MVINKVLSFSVVSFFVLFLSSSVLSLRSEVIWANRVVEHSGYNQQRGQHSNANSPNQLLGKPSVMPNFGESVCAWQPAQMRRNDFFIVEYSKSIFVEQVAIYENLNPGAIVKVTLYGQGKDTTVYLNSDPRPTERKTGRMFNIFCDKTSFRVNRVRVDINTYRYDDVYQIDAIALSDSKEPVEVKINLSTDVLQISKPENLGPNINTYASELAPVIAPDGKTIYFTRQSHRENIGNQNIWYSEMDKNGNFQKAVNIGPPLNTRYNNFAISILPDGNSMLVGNTYMPDGRVTGGFSMTYKKGNEWSFPEAVKIKNFQNVGGKGSYCLASNGKTLILSVTSGAGYGSNDLFVSFMGDDGIWSEPQNLGSTINTAEREDSPFLAADGVTLYFSSAGYPGYGSNDIFVTKRLDDTWRNWSEPINLGPQINTSEWDAYFAITALGDYAYFVSSQNSNGVEDIFRVQLPQSLRPERVVMVSGKVLDKKTNKPLGAVIHYEKLSTGESMGIANSNPTTGEYKIALPENEKYGFRAEAKNYVPISENLDLTNIDIKKDEISRNLLLVPLEKGQTITMNNLFFDFAEHTLLPESFPELDRLVALLKENSNMKITLTGHTDNVGTQQANMDLSNKRVGAVVDYLVEKGISKARITARGKGAQEPIESNNTAEGRAKNRRVECTITER